VSADGPANCPPPANGPVSGPVSASDPDNGQVPANGPDNGPESVNDPANGQVSVNGPANDRVIGREPPIGIKPVTSIATIARRTFAEISTITTATCSATTGGEPIRACGTPGGPTGVTTVTVTGGDGRLGEP